MKPNDFKLNTDYLTLANVENLTWTISVPTVTLPAGGLYSATYTFHCQNVPLCITRSQMHHSTWDNATLWGVGRFGETIFKNSSNNNFLERMHLTTPTGDTLQFKIELQGTPNTTAPAHTIIVKVFRFRVPNVF